MSVHGYKELTTVLGHTQTGPCQLRVKVKDSFLRSTTQVFLTRIYVNTERGLGETWGQGGGGCGGISQRPCFY